MQLDSRPEVHPHSVSGARLPKRETRMDRGGKGGGGQSPALAGFLRPAIRSAAGGPVIFIYGSLLRHCGARPHCPARPPSTTQCQDQGTVGGLAPGSSLHQPACLLPPGSRSGRTGFPPNSVAQRGPAPSRLALPRLATQRNPFPPHRHARPHRASRSVIGDRP